MLERRLEHIERHRAAMVADVRKDMDEARSRLLAHVAGLPAFRQELLDARSTLEWLAAYPDGPETYAFPSALALGLRKPVERTLGTTARVEYARVLEVLEEDAAALVDAFSDEQNQRLGITTERTPLKEAMWDDDDDHKAWKKQELDRARGLLPVGTKPERARRRGKRLPGMTLKVCTCGRFQPCPERGEAARQRARRDAPYGRILTSSRWQKARKAVKARDGERCQLDEGGTCYGRLEVHHRVPVREGGAPFDLDNLLVVCRGHHEQIEAKHRAAPRAYAR